MHREPLGYSSNSMKILVVTFPNDLGSRTIETNLCGFLEPVSDMKHFRFAAQDSDRIDQKIDNRRNIWHRIKDMLKLRSAVRSAVLEDRKILFYNVSPALFTLGSWRGGKIYITLDWARHRCPYQLDQPANSACMQRHFAHDRGDGHLLETALQTSKR